MKVWNRTSFALAALVAVLAPAACGDDEGPTGPQDEATVEMDDNFFSPQQVSVNVGGTVTWLNVGDRNHNTTSEGRWGSSNLSTGGTFEQTFNAAGTFEYECTLHDGMVGTVIVE